MGREQALEAARSEEELYDLHVYHRVDHEWCHRKLHALYGAVAARQDERIAEVVQGTSVLDVGAGYGALARRLIDRGFDVTAIDPHGTSRELARQWSDVEVLDRSIYSSGFPSRSFDTVVLREVGDHLEFDVAAAELARLARRAVVLFLTNTSPLVRACRDLVGHHEFCSPPASAYVEGLEKVGLRVDVVRYMDYVAFPLSGGYVTPQLLPLPRWAYPAVLGIDDLAGLLARPLGLRRHVAWRVLVRAVTDGG